MGRYFHSGIIFSLTLAAILLFQSLSVASPNYQERNGIFGEIKYAEFCNYSNSVRYRVKGEAGSRDARVEHVDFKIFWRPVKGINISGQPLGYIRGAEWRSFLPTYNTKSGDRRWYERSEQTPLTSADVTTPVKFAMHVYRKSPGYSDYVVDLGGIVNLGMIPLNSCRVYDDGNIR
ncbi:MULTISPECIES: hypothetical protein [unclassified Microcoleus]|uniref:hypothetical protein n=1 Tax=unclassified Microcoleus TaxID=2642155 RepID=UPI0025CC3F6B|nr:MULTISPECIES: hypothetical protein [unclassified Microcoleus]